MSWYKVWMAEDEPTAIATANAKARADWEDSDGECPCGKELGIECPVCTGAQVVTNEEHAAWVKQMEDLEPLPFE